MGAPSRVVESFGKRDDTPAPGVGDDVMLPDTP